MLDEERYVQAMIVCSEAIWILVQVYWRCCKKKERLGGVQCSRNPG